jgi:hypothetical protein
MNCVCVLLNVRLETIFLIWRRHYCIVIEELQTLGLSFDEGIVFIMPLLLRLKGSVFVVSSRPPPLKSASFDQQGFTEGLD